MNATSTYIAREGFSRIKYMLRQRIKKYEHLQKIALEVGDTTFAETLKVSIETSKRILDDTIGIEVACLINFDKYEQDKSEE